MKSIPLLPLATTFCLLLQAHSQDQAPLVLANTIPLPELPGGFNHMAVDVEHQRLFLTATTKKTLEIIDLKSGKPWRSLAGDGPAAALFAPEFNQLYVTRGHNLCIYAGTTFDLLTCKAALTNSNTIPKPNAFTSVACPPTRPPSPSSPFLTVSQKAISNSPAKPQGFVAEQKGNRISANIPSLRQIAVLDREKHNLLDFWPLTDVSGNYPIALDETNHRLFVGCRSPAQLVVFDTSNGRQVATVSIAADTDDLAYDSTHKRIYVACGDGTLDVIDERDADHYQLREQISTPPGSRNSLFSSEANQFYLAVPHRAKEPGETHPLAPLSSRLNPRHKSPHYPPLPRKSLALITRRSQPRHRNEPGCFANR